MYLVMIDFLCFHPTCMQTNLIWVYGMTVQRTCIFMFVYINVFVYLCFHKIDFISILKITEPIILY